EQVHRGLLRRDPRGRGSREQREHGEAAGQGPAHGPPYRERCERCVGCRLSPRLSSATRTGDARAYTRRVELRGASALVTGAGRGIGRAIALALAREGARVTAVARTESQLQSLVRGIEAARGHAVYHA